MQTSTRTTIVGAAAIVASLAAAGSATAAHDEIRNDRVAKYTYELIDVQDPEVTSDDPSGTTKIMELPNGNVKVEIEATGLVPNQGHAMHLHDVLGPLGSTCPGPERAGDDGIVSVLEGAPDYGGIVLSLTTSGDFSAQSGLALDRFPVADSSGSISYSRQFPADTVVGSVDDDAVTLGDIAGFAQVVVHGIDVNDNGAYDFDAGESSLNAPLGVNLPLEATAPALCGGVPN